MLVTPQCIGEKRPFLKSIFCDGNFSRQKKPKNVVLAEIKRIDLDSLLIQNVLILLLVYTHIQVISAHIVTVLHNSNYKRKIISKCTFLTQI
jgi:hypothetical protein